MINRDKYGRFISTKAVSYEVFLRDDFAKEAMRELIKANPQWDSSFIARDAYEIADDMMTARNGREQQ